VARARVTAGSAAVRRKRIEAEDSRVSGVLRLLIYGALPHFAGRRAGHWDALLPGPEP